MTHNEPVSAPLAPAPAEGMRDEVRALLLSDDPADFPRRLMLVDELLREHAALRSAQARVKELEAERRHVDGLGLISFDELVEQIRRWKENAEELQSGAIRMHDALAASRAREQELERDKARLDWLEAQRGKWSLGYVALRGKWRCEGPDDALLDERFLSAREAIDAAREFDAPTPSSGEDAQGEPKPSDLMGMLKAALRTSGEDATR